MSKGRGSRRRPLHVIGAPRRTRTPNLLVRSQTLYPVELWAQCSRVKPRSGGEGGIRTLGAFRHIRLAGVRLQPLGHLSRKVLPQVSSLAISASAASSPDGGGRGTRTPKGKCPAVFKTAALPVRSSPPKRERAPSRFASHAGESRKLFEIAHLHDGPGCGGQR
jgi:hypothetical protein